MKRKTLFLVSIALITILILIYRSIGFILPDDSEESYADYLNTVDKYLTKYYEVPQLDNWCFEAYDEYITNVSIDGETVGNIIVYPNNKYGSESSIISNIYGMHAYLKEELYNTEATYAMIVGYEKSAAEEMSNKMQKSDEIHYIYINKNSTMIDFCVDDSLADENVRMIMNSLKLK